MRIASFTQTYKNDREQLYQAYSNDTRLIEFKNLFHFNIHSFHNCKTETINKYKYCNKVENTIYFEFGDVPYGDTINKLIKALEEFNVTHLFFSQDDTFSADNDNIDFVEFLDYISINEKGFMINLSHLIRQQYTNLGLKEYSSFSIHETSTLDFQKAGQWSMDDTPFIASIDVVKDIYNKEYYSTNRTIWELEIALNERYKTETIQRFTLDSPIFQNYNIIGRNTIGKLSRILKLTEKNIILESDIIDDLFDIAQ